MQDKVQRHIVHRQVIDLHLNDESKARDWQSRMSMYCHRHIIPALEKVCNELTASGEHFRIDQLELTLDPIQNGDLQPDLAEKLAKRFKEKVMKLSVEQLQLVVDNETEEAHLPLGVTVAAHEGSSDFEALLHYIEYSIFPWWYDTSLGNIDELVRRSLKGKADLPLQKLIKLSIQTQPRLRLINLLKEQQLFACFDKPGRSSLRELYHDLSDFVPVKDLKNIFFQEFITQVVLQADNQQLEINETQAVVNILSASGYEFYNASDFKLKALERLKKETLLYQVLDRNLDQVKFLHTNDAYYNRKDRLTQGSKNKWDDPGINSNATETQPNTQQQKDHNEEGMMPLEPRLNQAISAVKGDSTLPGLGDSLETENAGAILLWPYLQMLFKELGLVEEKAFIDPESQRKAVQILHYLVQGDEVGAEHRWVIFKLLCGVKIEDFVCPEFELSKIEKEECQNLLKSVVRNWAVLKNTSPSGLQSSFLRRPGLLKQDHNGWVLHVHRIAIDVLINKLSWPISVIKLPWNKYSIHVKW
ncbi:MAG: contractile injection system tape measure protein [Bacteroidota bacterium]